MSKQDHDKFLSDEEVAAATFKDEDLRRTEECLRLLDVDPQFVVRTTLFLLINWQRFI